MTLDIFVRKNYAPEEAEMMLAPKTDVAILINAQRDAKEFLRMYQETESVDIQSEVKSRRRLAHLQVVAHQYAETEFIRRYGPGPHEEERAMYRLAFATFLIQKLSLDQA